MVPHHHVALFAAPGARSVHVAARMETPHGTLSGVRRHRLGPCATCSSLTLFFTQGHILYRRDTHASVSGQSGQEWLRNENRLPGAASLFVPWVVIAQSQARRFVCPRLLGHQRVKDNSSLKCSKGSTSEGEAVFRLFWIVASQNLTEPVVVLITEASSMLSGSPIANIRTAKKVIDAAQFYPNGCYLKHCAPPRCPSADTLISRRCVREGASSRTSGDCRVARGVA